MNRLNKTPPLMLRIPPDLMALLRRAETWLYQGHLGLCRQAGVSVASVGTLAVQGRRDEGSFGFNKEPWRRGQQHWVARGMLTANWDTEWVSTGACVLTLNIFLRTDG